MLGRKQHRHAQKKRKRKYKRNKCRQRRINKNEESSRPLRPPGIFHQAPTPKRQYHATPPRKNATMTTLLQGFPPVHGTGDILRPSGRHGGAHGRRRVGAKQVDKDFSQPPTNHDPRRSIALHHTCRPPICATTDSQSPSPSHRDKRSETGGIERNQPKTRSSRVSGHVGGDNLHHPRR